MKVTLGELELQFLGELDCNWSVNSMLQEIDIDIQK